MRKDLLAAGGAVFLFSLILTGCPDSPGEPPVVSSITVSGIPQTIGTEGSAKSSYKIYVSASDSMDSAVPHVAQGTKILIESDFTDGATIPLYAPPSNSGTDPDPDDHGDPWSGTAKYLSVTIAPQTVSEVQDLLFGAGMTLNASTANMKWADLAGYASWMNETQKEAIYTRIICKDGPGPGSNDPGITVQ